MASWKMAKAFGRAVARGDRMSKGGTGKGADFIDRSSQGARTNEAVNDAYNKGLREGYDDWDEVREKPGMQFDADALSDKEVRNRENAAFEQVDEEQSNKAMQSAFEQAFERAFNRESDWLEKGWLTDPDKSFGMPKFDDDTYQWLGSVYMADKAKRDKFIRDKMIEELRNGMPLSDFFERYRR